MGNKSKFYLSILGVLLAVGAVGFWIYKDITKVEERRASDNPPLDLETGGVKVEVLPTEGTLPEAKQPDLNKPIKFYNDLGTEFERLLVEKIEVSRRILRADPTQFREWVELGINYKRVDDFKSAEEAWYYAHLMIPDNAVVLGNLANLYAYYLKDNLKAEEYYKQATDVAGVLPYLYFQASDFYVNIMNDRAKAIAIVEKGTEKFPTDQDLQSLFSSLKSN